jgi:CBS-domain-containing membrane protein
MSIFMKSVATVPDVRPAGSSDPDASRTSGRGVLGAMFMRYKGDRSLIPARASLKAIGLAWLGGVVAIAVAAKLGGLLSLPLMLGSFGATCVLVFGYPDVPFSQPRNVIAGHVLSSCIGLAFLTAFGPVWWAMALATGTAIAVMMATRTVHPPAGSNPVIVFLYQPAWGFLLHPTLLGAVLIAVISVLYNNAVRKGAAYPKYW